MSTLWHFIQELSGFGNFIQGIADISIIWVAYLTIKGFKYKTVNLSVGSFKVRRKDCNVQNVTNLVSMLFYDGGVVLDSVRKEILEQTSPKYKELKNIAKV